MVTPFQPAPADHNRPPYNGMERARDAAQHLTKHALALLILLGSYCTQPSGLSDAQLLLLAHNYTLLATDLSVLRSALAEQGIFVGE